MKLLLLAVCCGLLSKPEVVSTELLCDASVIEAGRPVRVGVMFHMRPGWHVYWANPGDAGLPTSVKFNVPKGFVVSELSWPTPVVFSQGGGVTGHGYSGTVLLFATLTPPATLSGPVLIQADASWLMCNDDQCLPGSAKLQLELPVGKAVVAANAAVFEQWQRRVPVETEGSPLRTRTAREGEGRYAIELTWAGPAGRAVSFHPQPEEGMNVTDVAADGRRIAFRVERLKGVTSTSSTLSAVIGFTDAVGERRGVRLAIDLR